MPRLDVATFLHRSILMNLYKRTFKSLMLSLFISKINRERKKKYPKRKNNRFNKEKLRSLSSWLEDLK